MSRMTLQPARAYTSTGFARSGPRSLGNSTLEPARDRTTARGVERPRKRPNESEKRGVEVVRGLARSRSLRSLRSLGSSLAQPLTTSTPRFSLSFGRSGGRSTPRAVARSLSGSSVEFPRSLAPELAHPASLLRWNASGIQKHDDAFCYFNNHQQRRNFE